MEIIKYILLGIVQGLTEFLPVSSSGHLVLLEKLGVAKPSLFFNLLLHVSTLMAIIVVMRKDMWEWIKKPFSKEARWIYVLCIPTATLSFAFMFFGKELLLGKYLATGFFITSAVLFLSTIPPNKARKLSYKNALITGLAQGIAVLPGVSRSGMTISVMQQVGIPRDKALRLSFMMSVPVIIGGALWEGLSGDVGGNLIHLLAGCISAFFSGMFALKVMIKFFAQISFVPFAIYTFVVGAISLVLV